MKWAILDEQVSIDVNTFVLLLKLTFECRTKGPETSMISPVEHGLSLFSSSASSPVATWCQKKKAAKS